MGVVWATDGSATGVMRRRANLGFGYAGLAGQYGFKAARILNYDIGNQASLVAELQAVWLLLARELLKDGAPMTVFIDSEAAIRHLTDWATGSRVMPKGYVTRELDLPYLAWMVGEHREQVTFLPVKGHSGHLLNECADSLARIARRSLEGISKKETKLRARTLVEGFMADYRIREPVPS